MTDHDRAERLAGYLDEVSEDARFWARSHCLLFLARWVAIERPGFDLAPLFGVVSGPIGAARFLRRAGGIDAYVSAQAEAAGLEPTSAAAARVGAIGLIRIPRERRPGATAPGRAEFLTLGCIRAPDRWSVRTINGAVDLWVERMRVLPHLVWSV